MDFIKTKCKQRNVDRVAMGQAMRHRTKWGKKQKQRAINRECVRQR